MTLILKVIQIGTGIAFLLLTAAWIGLWYFLGGPAPTDQEMISWFNSHESSFDQIAACIKGNGTLDEALVDVLEGRSESSKAREAAIRKAMGINNDYGTGEERTRRDIVPPYWSLGILSEGPSKGYMYWDKDDLPCIENLDYCRLPFPLSSLERRPPKIACRKIKKNWYLLFQAGED